MASSPGTRTGVVLVTRNRLAMLQEGVRALRQQSHPVAEIIVVDNDSSDGTRAWLAQQTDLHVIRQGNLGGAGGFHVGIKTAYEHGHDWVWCMDDDGYPAPNCLERLLEFGQRDLLYRAPLVLAREDDKALAFGLCPAGSVDRMFTKAEALAAADHGLLLGVACPFNGVLFHREIMARVGFPVAEMFLWGDEVEYTFRIQAAGFRIATIVSAEFHHPRDRMQIETFTVFGRRLGVIRGRDPLRNYLVIRNQGFITRKYFGWYRFARFAVRYGLYRWKEAGVLAAAQAVWYAWKGACGKLDGHQKYLEAAPQTANDPGRVARHQ